MATLAVTWIVTGFAYAQSSDEADENAAPQTCSCPMMQGGMGAGAGGGMGMMGGPMRSMGDGMGTLGSGDMDGAPMMGMGMRLERMLALPDITDEQRRALQTRQRELQRELHRLHGDAMEARFRMQDLATQTKPDPKAVDQALQKLQEVHRRMAVATVKARNEAYDALTAEQRKALEQSPQPGMGMMRGGMRGGMAHH